MEVKAEKVKPYSGDGRQKGEQVRDMFDNIAPAYDFMNRAMTLGIDTRWRKRAVNIIRTDAQNKGTADYRILDVATGTADLAIMMAKRIPTAHITGIDLSKEMVEHGKVKVADEKLTDRIDFEIGDCMKLPFADDTYDCITAAFGVRNFEHLADGYREMLRVTRPGGMLCVIELSVPASPIVRPMYRLYTRGVIPMIGRMISKDSRAYSYLPESIEAVPQRTQMTQLIESVGFTDARYISLTLGVCTVYIARKPLTPNP